MPIYYDHFNGNMEIEIEFKKQNSNENRFGKDNVKYFL
jgi:hypothetical protein